MSKDLTIQKLNQMISSGMFSSSVNECLENTLNILNCDIKIPTAEVEIEGGGNSWWYVCGECRTVTNRGKKFCHECGRRLIWR